MIKELLEGDVREVLIEATKSRRFWEGRLKEIAKLLSWMYNKDILTKTEKKKQDLIFSQYYSYYNDGNFPKALELRGISEHDARKKIEAALEEYLEGFIKEILSKYLAKVDRTHFRYDKALEDVDIVIDQLKGYNPYSVDYWMKEADLDKDDKVLKLASELSTLYTKFKKMTKFLGYTRYTFTYAIDQIKQKGKWNTELQKMSQEIKGKMDDLLVVLVNTKLAIEKAKRIHQER